MLMYIFKNFRVKISYLSREMTIDKNTIVTFPKKGYSIPPSREATYSSWNGLQRGKKVQLDRENMQSTRSG